jgi:hypothetical protein
MTAPPMAAPHQALWAGWTDPRHYQSLYGAAAPENPLYGDGDGTAADT